MVTAGMKSQFSSFIKILIAYYGLIQSAHIFSISRSFSLFMQSGEITFLAWPPLGGWSAQAQYFLISLGAIDFFTALFALIFIYGYFSQRRWWFWLGTSTLTVSVISALVYGYGTIASGAWENHLPKYMILVVLFIPVAVLYIQFVIWGVKGKIGALS
jgi:hypothetical protein